MEVQYDLSQYFDTELVRLDGPALRRFNPKRCWAVKAAIDGMGKLSTEAQGLKRVLTCYEKIADARDDEMCLYMMWKKSPKPNRPNYSVILGILKIGRKLLYLFDKDMKCHKLRPVGILDFYVYEPLQRRGYGHYIYNSMLEAEGISPEDVAIDKPSESLLKFMDKYYGLTDPIWQNTNYVVYSAFFDRIENKVPPSPLHHVGPPTASQLSDKTAAMSLQNSAEGGDDYYHLKQQQQQQQPLSNGAHHRHIRQPFTLRDVQIIQGPVQDSAWSNGQQQGTHPAQAAQQQQHQQQQEHQQQQQQPDFRVVQPFTLRDVQVEPLAKPEAWPPVPEMPLNSELPIAEPDRATNTINPVVMGTPKSRGRQLSAAGIIHGMEQEPTRASYGPDTPQGRKNKRDYGHQALW